ncbi:uncharacterized protein OCT59_024512 [Rhizophagus irregularis]|uniref:Uncharacterized protein n=2 Tax=Rhizophagus irregularis TaxID=588596 RepID=A0A2P4Q9P7_RHIID|nr:hypothetical protein GLOIN_2v1826237 [Rhizophagus irregularis DAOM 181602=DAOM 197198]POG74318.1 hypothetical protein GLOIN_2v1826237 [Rhizophagus irregularis DAOM 181602=DAOM 197198]UZO04117.1 hypothetical protein OCT59_024512 [Rhizophagus irregularis]|eukprot:XP_025181184.1 hypothetical protein GLOIN_2v1826237 [Rhizophagus irregularis DAOM 181602=DAOM 197198]
MNNRRVHANNRLNDNKKLRRIKAVKDLFNKKDSRIMSYRKRDLLKILANHAYHSLEVSKTEDKGSKSVINVYDLLWRSEELRLLLRNVLDKHVRVRQMAQQLRPRNYDDEIQCYDKIPPDDAPDWSYVDQPDMVYDTEYTDDLNIDDEDLNAILEDKADKSESFMQED